jgi:hypothetical protein
MYSSLIHQLQKNATKPAQCPDEQDNNTATTNILHKKTMDAQLLTWCAYAVGTRQLQKEGGKGK